MITIDNNGITETDESIKTFANLLMSDKVYELKYKDVTPKIVEHKLKGISVYDGVMTVTLDTCYVRVTDQTRAKIAGYYLVRKDANKALEELCIKRILSLAKIIGGK